MNQNEILNSLFIAFYEKKPETIMQIISQFHFITPDYTFSNIPPNFKIYGTAPFPLLNITSTFGYLEASVMLLENGADVECTDGYKNSPLHCAAVSGNVDLIKLLLTEYNCNPTPLNYNKDLPIHIAASFNRNAAVSYLIDTRKNEIDQKNDLGKTALSIAVEKNNIELVQYLINIRNSDVKTVDNHRNTLLHIAVENKSLEVLQYLLTLQKINVNNINLDGCTPLHISARKGCFKMFNLLLAFKADPKILDKKGRTVVHYSIKSSAFDIFECIIQNKLAFPFQRDATLATPFHYAAASRDIRFLKVLASLDGSLINDVECGYTPLHIACKHQLLENVKMILTSPIIDPLIENVYGQNALHIAARSSNFELFSYILSGNCFDISIPDINGV